MQTNPITEPAAAMRMTPDTKVPGDGGVVAVPAFSLDFAGLTVAGQSAGLALKTPSIPENSAPTVPAPDAGPQARTGEGTEPSNDVPAPVVSDPARTIPADARPMRNSARAVPGTGAQLSEEPRIGLPVPADSPPFTAGSKASPVAEVVPLPAGQIMPTMPPPVLGAQATRLSPPSDAPGAGRAAPAPAHPDPTQAGPMAWDLIGERSQQGTDISDGKSRLSTTLPARSDGRAAPAGEASVPSPSRRVTGAASVATRPPDSLAATPVNAQALPPLTGRAVKPLPGYHADIVPDPQVRRPGAVARRSNPITTASPDTSAFRAAPRSDVSGDLAPRIGATAAGRPEIASGRAPDDPASPSSPADTAPAREPGNVPPGPVTDSPLPGVAAAASPTQDVSRPVQTRPPPGKNSKPWASVVEPARPATGNPSLAPTAHASIAEVAKTQTNAPDAEQRAIQFAAPNGISGRVPPGGSANMRDSTANQPLPRVHDIRQASITVRTAPVAADITPVDSRAPASAAPGPIEITGLAPGKDTERLHKASADLVQAQSPVTAYGAPQPGVAAAAPVAHWQSTIPATPDLREIPEPPAELVRASGGRAIAPEAPRIPPDIQLPRHVVQQLVDAARVLPDRPVELSLNPEELGRVRMTLVTGDSSISVALTAERPETADLLRRHIEMLSQEFRQLGYRDISFSFAGGHARHDGQGPDETAPPPAEPLAAEPVADSASPLRIALSDGVDIRL